MHNEVGTCAEILPSELRRREFLLKGFEWFVDNADFIFTE